MCNYIQEGPVFALLISLTHLQVSHMLKLNQIESKFLKLLNCYFQEALQYIGVLSLLVTQIIMFYHLVHHHG